MRKTTLLLSCDIPLLSGKPQAKSALSTPSLAYASASLHLAYSKTAAVRYKTGPSSMRG